MPPKALAARSLAVILVVRRLGAEPAPIGVRSGVSATPCAKTADETRTGGDGAGAVCTPSTIKDCDGNGELSADAAKGEPPPPNARYDEDGDSPLMASQPAARKRPSKDVTEEGANAFDAAGGGEPAEQCTKADGEEAWMPIGDAAIIRDCCVGCNGVDGAGTPPPLS